MSDELYVRRNPGTYARQSFWFQQYCDMGPERSFNKLSASAPAILDSHPGNGRPPGVRSLQRWSNDFNWQARVRAWDDQQAQQAREEATLARSRDRDRRKTDRLKKIDRLKAVIDSAMVKQIINPQTRRPELDQHGTPRLTLKEFSDYSKDEAATLLNMLKLAFESERLELGEATARAELTGEDGGPIVARTTQVLDASALAMLRPWLRPPDTIVGEVIEAETKTLPDHGGT